MTLIHPDYLKEISDIEERINRYEKASRYLRDVESQLQQMDIIGFDEDIHEIKEHLNDLQSYDIVKDLMKHLKIDIDNYRIDYNMLKTDLERLQSYVIKNEKRLEIKLLLV